MKEFSIDLNSEGQRIDLYLSEQFEDRSRSYCKIAIDDQRKLINYVQRCPKMNNFNEKVLKAFAKEYAKIPYSVISQISSINYAPQNADETRCEFIMDDGKILYLRYDQMANQLKGNYYALLMEKYPDDKYYDFLGKYVYRSK